MEKVIGFSTWSLNWPPPEFEKAKRAVVACLRFLKACVHGAWVLMFVAPPEQERIEETRARARQLFMHI